MRKDDQRVVLAAKTEADSILDPSLPAIGHAAGLCAQALHRPCTELGEKLCGRGIVRDILVPGTVSIPAAQGVCRPDSSRGIDCHLPSGSVAALASVAVGADPPDISGTYTAGNDIFLVGFPPLSAGLCAGLALDGAACEIQLRSEIKAIGAAEVVLAELQLALQASQGRLVYGGLVGVEAGPLGHGFLHCRANRSVSVSTIRIISTKPESLRMQNPDSMHPPGFGPGTDRT